MVTLLGTWVCSCTVLGQQGHSSLFVVVSQLVQQCRHTKFPQPNSTGLSSRPMQMVHSMSVFVCVLGEGGSVEGKNEAGAMAASIDARALAVPKLGLPGFPLPTSFPPVWSASK